MTSYKYIDDQNIVERKRAQNTQKATDAWAT